MSRGKLTNEERIQAVQEYFNGKGGYKSISERYNMSRVGRCIDNGPMEGWWGILKSEMYYLRKFTSKSELIKSITDYITYYNTRRYQIRLCCMSPMEYHYTMMYELKKLKSKEEQLRYYSEVIKAIQMFMQFLYMMIIL